MISDIQVAQEASCTKYMICMWTGSQDDHPFPQAVKEGQYYFVSLKPDDIVALTRDYDVMISNPSTSEIQVLALNKKGRKFGQTA